MTNAPPHSRVGAWLATHHFLVGLVEAGHTVQAVVENRVGQYDWEGVRYQQEDPFTALYIQDCDVVVSNNGGTGHGHLAAIHYGKPSVKFVHGSSPGFREQLVAHGPPVLAVFNSHSLLELSGYTGRSIVCPPPLRLKDWETIPGECITLVNLTVDKGAHTLDQLARYLPDYKFLGVKGGYGTQVTMWRRNLTVIDQTLNMRDDVYGRTRILLMPGLLETWGMVGLEAMCSGIPVIAHPAQGPKESLGKAAMYADRDDLDAWIDKIVALDDMKTYDAWSRKAKARARAHAASDPVAVFVKTMEEMFP
jgi:glycosyltransferase involved in cell wall biosynthesis